MVGLPGFEPGSVTPEATSLDQASRKPHKTGLARRIFLGGFLNSVGLALNLSGAGSQTKTPFPERLGAQLRRQASRGGSA
jgi:hypothetical protein